MELSMDADVTLQNHSGVAGPFAERLMAELGKGLDFNGFSIEIKAVELSTNPFSESVSVDFHVTPIRPERSRVRKIKSAGPVLSFSFSASSSVDDNLAEFRKFVSNHAETAATAPQVTRSMVHRRNR